LSASDPDGGIVRFSQTGLPHGLILDEITGIITGIPLSTGTFTVRVFASDGSLSSSGTFDWTVQRHGSGDTTAPSLAIMSPAAGQSVVNAQVTVSGTASDSGLGDSGIVRVTVNGQLAAGGTASGSGTANWSRTLSLSGTSTTIVVEALDGAGNYSAELFTLSRDVTAPSLAITSHTSGQTVSSSTITLSGIATDSGTGGNGISRVTVNGSTAAGGTVSGNNSASWSRTFTLSSGLNSVTVVATDGAGNTRTASLTITYTPASLAMTSLTSNLASPQAPGTSIRFTVAASGGTTPYQFKWWVLSDGVWSVAQNWSSSATFNWQPAVAGTYVVAAWARNAGVTADASQALAQVSYVIATGPSSGGVSSGTGTPLTFTSLTSDPSSPRTVGTTINFTAAVAGGTPPYQFKWWVQNEGVWRVAREWSDSPTLTWQPAQTGGYIVAVWARNAGVTADASQALAQIPYIVSSGVTSGSNSSTPLSITSLTSDLSSPRAVGTTINFTAAAAGGTAPYQFKWWVQSGGVWSVAREWSSSPTLAWQPTTVGTYMVAVWGRNAGVTADASQALAQLPFSVSPGGSTGSGAGGSGSAAPLSITSLLSDRASPQAPGAVITFTTAVTGGTGPHQFKWWVQSGGVWTVAQDWSTNTSFAWRPPSTGTYVVAVWGRNAGVTVDASQAMAQTTYIITSNGLMPLSVTSLSSNLSSSQRVWTTVLFTANASGGTAPYQFKWWVYDGTTWSVARDWNSSASLSWQPTIAGNYVMAVWVRNAGATVDASEALAQVPYLITP
jgi:hypothetical protein